MLFLSLGGSCVLACMGGCSILLKDERRVPHLVYFPPEKEVFVYDMVTVVFTVDLSLAENNGANPIPKDASPDHDGTPYCCTFGARFCREYFSPLLRQIKVLVLEYREKKDSSEKTTFFQSSRFQRKRACVQACRKSSFLSSRIGTPPLLSVGSDRFTPSRKTCRPALRERRDLAILSMDRIDMGMPNLRLIETYMDQGAAGAFDSNPSEAV
ncbi:uncharacterized protein EV422DRAFT_25602 [Fimicolochytrium jonesii]|uniref:uncharacterized protein n=1 Tax=Fimicolochytrium jonesii TaxID=1396493 RepID=UPI0022FE221B|nr:uncharacterized protein EV422DRAFT_25602 [Fimicolochytrium jonesii]KAI8827093.1 hypothetical protein EV422DRAFT_25602 [Fimicolochytrium jonesii]